jgi:hypothetical protein
MDMKKILLVVVLLLGFITIAGCTTDDEKDAFIVEVVNLDGDIIISQSITFDSESTIDLIELIDEAVGLDYTEFSFGTFINGIGGNYPTEYGVTYNYYFSLFVDGVSSDVGLDQVVVTDGTKISFIEVTLLDETDLEVDRLIELFIDTYVDDYLSNTMAEHHVAAAIHQLHVKGYDVPALSNWISNPASLLARDTISNAMKTTIYETIFSLDQAATKTALQGFTPSNHYESVALLTAYSLIEDSDIIINQLISQVISTFPTYMDSDFAGMAMLSIAPYHAVLQVDAAKDSYIDYIQDNLTATGVTAWGNSNSSSTAAVILGLVAFGINPRGEDFQTDGVDLIEALLLYSDEGAFKWTIDSETPDLMFSTPQVFAALVAYKLYRDVYENPAFILFDIAQEEVN